MGARSTRWGALCVVRERELPLATSHCCVRSAPSSLEHCWDQSGRSVWASAVLRRRLAHVQAAPTPAGAHVLGTPHVKMGHAVRLGYGQACVGLCTFVLGSVRVGPCSAVIRVGLWCSAGHARDY